MSPCPPIRQFVALVCALALMMACSSGSQGPGPSSSDTPAADLGPSPSGSGSGDDPSDSGSSDSDSGSTATDGESTPQDPPSDVSNPQTVPPPPPDPTLYSDFTTDDGTWAKKSKPTGSVTFGAVNAAANDQKVARLIFSGSPGSGPGNASRIKTTTLLGFGTYRARVSFATCSPSEEAVNGVFTYSYGGTNGLPLDSNGNGITDNNEIDFEILCGEPRYLWMTSWTDYQVVSGIETFRKVTRVLDMKTGKAYQTVAGKEGKYGIGSTVVETIPEAVVPNFATTGEFYELGFDWKSDSLRFFMMLGGKEITLWTLNNSNHPNGASYIPQNKAFMYFNLWHTTSHWYSGGSAASPALPATLDVDWFKYWAS